MKVRKFVRKLTPSGYSDNGIWILSEDLVEFPESKLQVAIVETVSLKGCSHKAVRVTIDGKSWNVDQDPRGK